MQVDWGLQRRTLEKVLVGDDCWLWQASHQSQGYAQIYAKVNGQDSMLLAHRVMYEMLVGPIPDGLVIDHLCRNHGCLNPSHMEPVTSGENTRRGEAGINNTRKTHCPHGHEYTPENILLSQGRRNCRACRRKN